MTVHRLHARCALILITSLGGGIGFAQAQGSAAGAALSAPAQAKVAAPAASATVKPGAGGGSAATPAAAAELAAAIASGDVRRALELGASAREIALMMRSRDPGFNLDPNTAVFVRTSDGQVALGGTPLPPAPPGAKMLTMNSAFIGYVPPGGLESLPTSAEALGPPPAPTPAMAAVGQMFLAGGAPRDVAAEMLKVQPLPVGAPNYDLGTARYVQGPDGAVGLALTTPDGGSVRVSRIPGSEAYAGISSLPTVGQAFPAAAGN